MPSFSVHGIHAVCVESDKVFVQVSTVVHILYLALIMESSFQNQGNQCGISDEQSGSGAGFSPSGACLFCHSLFCQCFIPTL